MSFLFPVFLRTALEGKDLNLLKINGPDLHDILDEGLQLMSPVLTFLVYRLSYKSM